MAALAVAVGAQPATAIEILEGWNLNLIVADGVNYDGGGGSFAGLGNSTNIEFAKFSGTSTVAQTINNGQVLGEGFTASGSFGITATRQVGNSFDTSLTLGTASTLSFDFNGLTGTLNNDESITFNPGAGTAKLILGGSGNSVTLATFEVVAPSQGTSHNFFGGGMPTAIVGITLEQQSGLSGLWIDSGGEEITPSPFNLHLGNILSALDSGVSPNPTNSACVGNPTCSGVSVATLTNIGQYKIAGPSDVVWDDGGADQLWTTPQNWDNDTVPSDGDNVLIDDGNAGMVSAVVLDQPATVSDLAIDAGDSLSLDSGSDLSIGTVDNAGTLDILSGGILSARAGSDLTNTGTFTVAAGGQVTDAGGSTYVQTAGSTAVEGVMTMGDVQVNGGTLCGSGLITGAVTNGGGTIMPGCSLGTLVIDGNLTIDTGVLQLEDGDMLDVSGLVEIGANGMIELYFDAFTMPTTIDFADFFSNSQPTFGAGFQGSNFSVFTMNPGQFDEITIVYGNNQSVMVTATAALVPEPSALILFGFGLAGLGFARRRRVA